MTSVPIFTPAPRGPWQAAHAETYSLSPVWLDEAGPWHLRQSGVNTSLSSFGWARTGAGSGFETSAGGMTDAEILSWTTESTGSFEYTDTVRVTCCFWL